MSHMINKSNCSFSTCSPLIPRTIMTDEGTFESNTQERTITISGAADDTDEE